MKKLSLSCLFLFASVCFFNNAASASDAGGQQYVEPYNDLVNAINERIETFGGTPLTKKNKEDSVTQADLGGLRWVVGELLGHFVDSSDPATAKSLTINDGKGFTMVPGDYTSTGNAIYGGDFIGVPILRIHFTELQDILNKMKTVKTTPNVSVSLKGGKDGSEYSTSSFGDAVANFNWLENGDYSFTWSGKTFSMKHSDKLGICRVWLYWDSNNNRWYRGIDEIYGYSARGRCYDNLTLTLTVPASAHRSSAKLSVLEETYTLTGVMKQEDGWLVWMQDPQQPEYKWREFLEFTGSQGGEKSKTESINFTWCPDPPSPTISPDPPDSFQIIIDWEYGMEKFIGYNIADMVLMSEYDFSEISLKPSEIPDTAKDGLVADGCDCTTCAPEVNLNRFVKELGVAITVSLNYSKGESGLRVLAYVTDYTAAGQKKQMFSLDTGIISDASGHDPADPTNTYHFVEVLRPSGADVVYSLEGKPPGKPVNGEKSQTMKITEDGGVEISFVNDVIHRFGGGALVQCRKKSSGIEELVINKEAGGWPGLKVEGSDGKMIKLTGPSFYTIPIYTGDFITDRNLYSLSGTLTGRSERSCVTDPDGVTTTSVTNYDGLGRASSKFEIIYNLNNETCTEKIYDTVSGTVIKTVVRSEEIVDPLNKILREVVNPGAENLVSTKNIRTFPWGTEITEEKIAVGTAFEKTTKYTFYDDPENDGPNYSNLKLQENPDGSWTRYVYDSKDRVVKAITPFGDAAPDAAEDQCQVAESDYSAIPESPDTADDDDTRAHKVTLFVKGTPVSRSMNLYYGNKTVNIRCASPGAAWDDPANIVTSSESYTAADDDPSIKRRGRIKKMTNAAGTISVYTYSISGGNLCVTCDTGAGSGYTVTDGARNVTISDKAGNTISETSSDISSSITLADTSYVRDDFGRTTRTNYMDGAFTATVYGCCGPEKETNREGTVTVKAYTGLKQLSYTTTAGVCNLYIYDVSGNVISETRKGSDGSEFTTTNAYNPAGEQISTTDPMGNTTIFKEETTENSRQTTVTNPDGSTIITTSNRDRTTAEQSGTAVHPVKYEYGVDGGELYTKVIPVGNESQWTKSYTDFLGRTYKSVYADGSAAPLFYNPKGQLVKSVDPAGRVTLYQYNAKGELELTAIDMNGNSVIDLAGTDRVTKHENGVAADPAHGNVRKSTTYIFPENTDAPVAASVSDISADGLSSWNSSFGRTASSSTVYNGGGQKTVTMTNPDGSTVTQIYQDGKLISSELCAFVPLPLCASSTYTYDGHNRLASETRTENGEPRTTFYSYDNNDRLIESKIQNSEFKINYIYDSMGRRISQTQPGGRTTTYTYAPTGELTGTSGSDTYPVTYTYDSMGRLKTLTDGNGNTTTWNYDPLRGFLSSKTYADGQGSSYTYNPDGALKTRTWSRVTQAFQPVVSSYSYNAAGDLTGVAYSDGTTPNLTYTRDRLGRPVSILCACVPLPLCTSFTYNPDSSLAVFTVPYISNHSISYGYDLLGRRTSMSLKNGATDLQSTSYGYDGMSRLSTISDGTITANYARIPGTNLLSITNYTKDTNNIMTVSRSYDSLNRLTSISTQTLTPSPKTLSYSYQYNDRDQRSKVTLADGSYWEYTYDDMGQVISGKKYNSANIAIPGQDFGYSFDAIGNRTQCSIGVPACEYSYSANALNQYTQRTVPGIIPIIGQAAEDATVKIHRITTDQFIDPARDGKSFSHSLNVDNSTQSVEEALDIYCYKTLEGKEIVEKRSGSVFVPKTPEAFLHDADGNLLSDGKWQYTWDAENRLISSTPLVPSATSKKVEFAYDYMNRKTSCKIYNWTGSAWELGVTEKYAWDGMTQIAVFDGSNVLKEAYLWGEDLSGTLQGAGGVGGLLAVKDASGTYIPAYDGSGNIVAYVDASNSAKVAEIEYDAFGRQIVKSGIKADDFRFRFSTKPYRRETGMIEYEQRPYIPEIGRFPTRDPLGERGGNNPYRITSNDLINKYDVLGMWGSNVHLTRTKTWATDLKISSDTADIIGASDNEIDTLFDPTDISDSNWSWHFNRATTGDSRFTHRDDMVKLAKCYCDWSRKKDIPSRAAVYLGYGLHPLQDWVAHGDYNRKAELPAIAGLGLDTAFLWHNFAAGGYFTAEYPDSENLDTAGPNGRATVNVFEWMTLANGGKLGYTKKYFGGNQRITLTEKLTKKLLHDFQEYVQKNGKPGGECCKKFLGGN